MTGYRLAIQLLYLEQADRSQNQTRRDTGTEATGPRFLRDAFNIATEDPTTAELPKQAEH